MTDGQHEEPDNRPPPPRLQDCNPANLVSLGGHVRAFRITLRVFGDGVSPSEISQMLALETSSGHLKGERLPGKYARTARTGSWLHTVESDRIPNCVFEDALNQLLDHATNDLAVWHVLTKRFKVDLFCGLFMEGGTGNEGIELDSATMKRLVDRQIAIGFDIYY